jgi:hypothetical protein
LRPVVARLKGGATEERIRAAEELAGLGERAAPAARALCEVAMHPSQKVSRAALQALEKVAPDLHEPVFVLLVDNAANNHLQALTKLGLLGDQGKPAVPVVFHQIKKCQEQLEDRAAPWDQQTLIEVITKNLETLPKIAPEDRQVVKTVTDLTRFETQRPVRQTPFRDAGVRLLGELGEGHAEHRKQIVPTLANLLKEAAQQTNSAVERVALSAIEEVDHIGNALIRCGPEAKQALSKEVLPRLKELQFHRSAAVRRTAEQLRQKIEEAP